MYGLILNCRIDRRQSALFYGGDLWQFIVPFTSLFGD